METNRFSLQKYKPGCKISCPQCGKNKCFSRYIDTKGTFVFPDFVGRCDHENSCKYHLTPREFFECNPLAKEQLREETKEHQTVASNMDSHISSIIEIEPSYFDIDIMKKSLNSYNINPLYHYFSGVFGKAETERLFQLYNVGTSKKWGGSAVFWQVDYEGRIRTGKVMCYNQYTGHRVKEPHAYVSWAHSLINQQDYNLKQCLFGEHLLTKQPYSRVMIVESEKTALIASHFMPSYIWLATGGKNGCFNKAAMQVLKGRKVTLIPDLGALDEWIAKSEILNDICESVSVNTILEEHSTDEQRQQGLDIADFLLMTETKQMVLTKMIRRYPYIQNLIDKFDLEVIEDE